MISSRQAGLLLCWIAVLCLGQVAVAQQGPEWGAPPAGKPEAGGVEWASGGKHIPLGDRGDQKVTFPPTTRPIAVIGNEFYDLAAGRPLLKLVGEYDHTATAMSGDGRYFAATVQDRKKVCVWSLETGQRILLVEAGGPSVIDVKWVGIGAGGMLLVCVHNKEIGGAIETWDIEKRIRLRAERHSGSADKICITPDGRFMAAVQDKQVRIYDVRSGAVVATMRNPQINEAVTMPNPQGGPAIARPPRAVDAVFLYAWAKALTFTPSGKELAMVTTHPSLRLIVWSNSGDIVFNEAIVCPQFTIHNETLAANADGSLFLLGGGLVDRKARRIVCTLPMPWANKIRPHFVDKDRVFMPTGDSSRASTLELITLPVAAIQKSIDVMLNPKVAALLRPGDTISIKSDITNVRFDDPENTRKQLEEALAARLAQDGFKVGPGREVTLTLKYQEEAGERLKVVEQSSPFDRNGRDTGRTAEESKGYIVLDLRAKSVEKPLWTSRGQAGSASSFREEVTDQSVRTSMLKNLQAKIRTLEMPYFIPADPQLVSLPLNQGKAEQ